MHIDLVLKHGKFLAGNKDRRHDRVRNHPHIALFCFADGHALPLSQTVDIGVYMRAISPAGSLYGQTVDAT